MAVIPISATSPPAALRPLDPSRDLAGVADLIELCFSNSLEAEGKDYLRQMRAAARSARLWGWAYPLAEQGFNAPTGFVWEENGRIIGNVSLFAFTSQGQPGYLIANVAVHPTARRRGIGRALTERALEYIHRRGANAWLQVRDDNPVAIHLYRSLGFVEVARRTTWQGQGALPPEPAMPQLSIAPRQAAHWPQQRDWLRRLYPPELAWHLPLNWRPLPPDWPSRLYRWMTLEFPRHWAAQQGGYLHGVLTWQHANGHADWLWLAIPPNFDLNVVQALLTRARRQLPRRRAVILDFPAGLATQAFQAAGLSTRQTLLWMRFERR